MRVACDIDGVLLDTVITFCELFNKKHGTSYQKSDVTKWEFFIDWNIPEDDIWDIFYQIYKDSMSVPFIDDRIPSIMMELNQTHDVSIVSARTPQYRESILRKLRFHRILQGSHYNELVLLFHKPYDLKMKQDFDVIIDDNPKLAESIKQQKDKILLLFDQPWNQEINDAENIIRVRNWSEIEEYFSSI
jgi:uncharacterized HAD superfamily protein